MTTTEVLPRLDGPQAEVLRTKRCGGARTASAWLALLGPLARYDRIADAQRSGIGVTGLVSGVVAIILTATGVGAPLGLPLLAFAVYKGVRAHQSSVQDLRNNLREFVVPLVRVLAQDMDAAATLTLNIDVSGVSPAKQLGENTNDQWFTYPKTVTRLYRDDWLTGEAVLADGARLAFRVTDMVRMRETRRKNYRGRIKTKHKCRIKHHLVVKLALPASAYAIDAPAPMTAGNAAFEARGKRGVYTASTVVVSEGQDGIVPLRAMLDLIAQAYGAVPPNTKPKA